MLLERGGDKESDSRQDFEENAEVVRSSVGAQVERVELSQVD
jgi:hypothetical protein